MPRNPSWQRDELILALDLYFRLSPARPDSTNQEVVELSRLLNRLPLVTDRPDAARFRNPNGVAMKLSNFLRFDPRYPGTGLPAGGHLEESIWEEFEKDRPALRRLAQEIARAPHANDLHGATDPDEATFPEGRVMYRRHRQRERSPSLVAKAKARALKSEGKLSCACCGFDFAQTYGPLGEGFIECHHLVPISEYSTQQTTRVADVVLVCSNCHRMLHRRRPWLGLADLRSLISCSS
ncbi:MAG: HNH endonuclease [Sulfobacillus sp.]